ncbi:WxcM-like domain-containing protein [Bradyrhizobium shewense]|uniref:WxcM-like domain-containing protein n=1 Tax=Bradyrhizobium shewense TaxID=1761772 RepID=UPI000B850C91|nr:WxcM-like domain-containing protein [Bradyrhizobium shewense]
MLTTEQTTQIHKTAEVLSVRIGERTRIWQFVVVLSGAKIGADTNICSHCFIENDVIIGDRVTVKSGVQLWDGMRVGNDVFIGPNVSFTNDKFPRSKRYPEAFLETRIEDGASLGAGAIILPGVTIGRGAMVGAGSVVTKSIPPHSIVFGSPARIKGYVESLPNSETARDLSKAVPEIGSTERLSVRNVTVHRMARFEDIRGSLSVGNFPSDIPFEAKRYFLVFDVPSIETRGQHAHRQCHQFLICVRGSCSVVVDDGHKRAEVRLNSPNKGIYLPPMVWGVQYNFTSDAVLLVFASDRYNPDDYIRSYSEFVELVREEP